MVRVVRVVRVVGMCVIDKQVDIERSPPSGRVGERIVAAATSPGPPEGQVSPLIAVAGTVVGTRPASL